jgi:hypothetical protein
MKKIFLCICIVFASFGSFAQTQQQTSGWFLYLTNIKLNQKWGLVADVQLRSANDFGYLRNFLVRPGVTYFINKNNNVTLGYLLATTKTEVAGAADINIAEHRIWEQYIYTHKLSSIFATHRLRMEQRFIEQNNGTDIFAQRFRYFFRLIQPLQAKAATFERGAFVALQNEVFLNVQHKDLLNKSLFDQNRAYLAAGYRFSKKLDLELGYLNQATNGLNNYTINNIVQFAVYTRF